MPSIFLYVMAAGLLEALGITPCKLGAKFEDVPSEIRERIIALVHLHQTQNGFETCYSLEQDKVIEALQKTEKPL